jgi:hypothetical protein
MHNLMTTNLQTEARNATLADLAQLLKDQHKAMDIEGQGLRALEVAASL